MNLDEKSYREFLNGNIQGFEELVIKHKNNLIYFIQRYIGDLHQAEDLAQDVFVEVYIHKERYNFKNTFKTYLFTIAKHKAIDYVRKQSKIVITEEIKEDIEEQENFEEKLIAKESEKELLNKIKLLKKEYQVVLYLIDLEELSYKESGKILGKTQAQIKILIYRARKSLKKILEKEGLKNEK